MITLKEIVVTGEWVKRPLSETTTSVTLLPEESLQRNDAYRIYDTVRHVPNLTPAPPDFLPAIRGLQSGGPLGLGGGLLAATQPRAKLIVGGVERLANYANNVYQSMFDVEQVEVLRGPQATTRGPNAIAGVFNVKTKDPVFVREGAVQTRFDWNEVSGFGKRVNFMGNVPTGKELAMRFVLQYETDRNPIQVYDDGNPTIPPGTDFDDLSAYNTLTLRNKFLWVPQSLPDFSGLFTLEYQTGRDSAFDSWIWGSDSAAFAPDGIARDPEDRMYGFSGGQRIFDTEDYGFTSDLRYTVGETGEIRAITAYMNNAFQDAPDSNSIASGVTFTSLNRDLLTQYLLYTFEKMGSLDGIVGASYRLETGDTRTGVFAITSEDEREALSAFADLTYHLSDDFRLLGGGRIMRNTVIFNGMVVVPVGVNQDDTVVLPKAGFAYDLDERQTMYATARRGFNPGGGGVDFGQLGCHFFGTCNAFYEYDPEYVWTYEVGYRGNLMDNIVTLNATVFYNQYDDYQFFWTPNPNSSRIVNYDGNTYGAELEARAQVTDAIELIGGVGLLKTKIDAPGETIDGNRFGLDPEITLNTGFVWQVIPRMSVDVVATYVNQYSFDFTELPGTESGDYVNVDAGVTGDINGFTVRGWVRNVLDELQYYQKQTPGGSGYVLPPREIGITVTYAF